MTPQNKPKMGAFLRKITQYLVVLSLLLNGFSTASLNSNSTIAPSPTNSSNTVSVTNATRSTSSPAYESRQKLAATTRGE